MELKFRGKRTDNGQWVYGLSYQYQGKLYIANEVIEHPSNSDPAGTWIYNEYEVNPETVGQSTTLSDKNGNDIYEGDILTYKNEYGRKNIHRVYREKGGLVINSHSEDINKESIDFYEATADMQTAQWIEQCVIIGNIHDNPNLLTQ